MIDADRGLVLRCIELRETSKIVSLLGARHGRLRLVARGVRGPGSRAGASLEVGNEVELVFSLTPGRELGILREVSLSRAWLAGSRRLEVLGAGLAAVELLDQLLPEGAAEPAILDDTLAAFAALHASLDRAGALLVFYAFELRLLGRLGLQPDLSRCPACGSRPGEGAYLDVAAGTLHCAACGRPGPRRLRLPRAATEALAHLSGPAWLEVAALPTEVRTRRLVGLAVHRLLGAHLERYRYPRSLELLKNVDRRAASAPGSRPPAERGSVDRPRTQP